MAKDEKFEKPETPEPVFIVGPPPQPTPYELAIMKAQNPRMSLVGNPLAPTQQECQEERIEKRNMKRLEKDAKMRCGPNGGVYAGVMDMRYRG